MGALPPCLLRILLWPSVNKIQLFSALQMQPEAVCLCNKPHILWVQINLENQKGKLNTLSSQSPASNILPNRPHPVLFSPSHGYLRETSPRLTFQVILGSVHPALRSLKKDLPLT